MRGGKPCFGYTGLLQRTGRGHLGRWLAATILLVCQAGFASDLVELQSPGAVLTARLNPGESWPSGHTVLLLHGTLSHRDTEIIESLELLFGDYGLSTLAVNLGLGIDRRQGPYPCDGNHRHLENDASAELALWMNWLQDQGARDITLLGHSRGAYQVARYLFESGDARVRRQILVAPPTWSAEESHAAYRERHGVDLDPLLQKAAALVADGRGDEMLPGTVGLLYCSGGRVSAASLLSYYAADPLRDTPTLLGEMDIPTLVVTGSEDTVVGSLNDRLADAGAGALSNVQHVDIRGADHFFRDLYADELVDFALDFIESSGD